MIHFLCKRRIICCLSLFCFCVFFSLSAKAQVGKIKVSVQDAETQRAIDNAAIEIQSREGKQYTNSTNEQGVVSTGDLATGLYEVRVSRAGYQTSLMPSVRVVNKKNTVLKIQLTPIKGNLEEVLVMGDIAGADSLSSAGTRFIDREALRSAAGSGSDILRALDGLPGLFSSGEFASFTVRGNGPRDNLILVDGFPFDNVVHFDDSFGEQEEIEGGGRYSVFAPNLISGAEFQPGGWSAAYGGRSGSLLKLEVAEGNPDTASYTTRLDIAGLEVGYDGPSGFADNTSILFSVRQLDFGRLFDMVGASDIGTPTLTDIILKSTSKLSDNDTFSILAIYAPEEFTRDVDNVLASDEDDPGNFEDIELANNKTDNMLLGFTWSRLIGENAEWVNRIYYRYYDEQSSNGEAFPDLVPLGTPARDIPVRNNIIQSERKEKEIGFRSDFSTLNRFGKITAGLRVTQLDLEFDLSLDDNWIRYVYDQNDFRPNRDQRFIELTPEAVNNQYADTGTSYAAYIDQTFEFDRWELRPGLRVDKDGISNETLVSPRLGSRWTISDKIKLSATAGRYIQAPRFNDRAADENNKDIENEIVDQLSLGVNYLLTPNVEFLIEPYYQDLKNLVVETDGVNQTVSNLGEGRSFGVDTAISRRFSHGWSGNINYSYNDARVKDGKNMPYYDADFSRPHSFSLGGIWEMNDRWKFSFRWKWATGTPRDEFIIHENVLESGQPLRFSKEIITTNTERYSHFHSLNFRIDYRRTFGNTSLISFFDVINAYGSDNPSSSEFNERTGKDVIEEGEVLPLIGVRLEW